MCEIAHMETERFKRMCFLRVTGSSGVDRQSRYYEPIHAMALYYIQHITVEGPYSPKGGSAYFEHEWARELAATVHGCWMEWLVGWVNRRTGAESN